MQSKAQKTNKQTNIWNSEFKDNAKYTSEAQKKKIELLSDLKQDSVRKMGREKEVKI